MQDQTCDPSINEDHFQIFVGGCPPEITIDQLKDYFS